MCLYGRFASNLNKSSLIKKGFERRRSPEWKAAVGVGRILEGDLRGERRQAVVEVVVGSTLELARREVGHVRALGDARVAVAVLFAASGHLNPGIVVPGKCSVMAMKIGCQVNR